MIGTRSFAACILAVALAATPASATHGNGKDGDEDYAPKLDAADIGQYPNAPSDLRLILVQNDHEAPAIDVRYRFPLEWRFAPDLIRPAEKANGTPATTCTDVMANFGLGFEQDENPAEVRRAEHIGTVEFRAYTNTTRNEIVNPYQQSASSGAIGPAAAPNQGHIAFGKLRPTNLNLDMFGVIALRAWDADAQRADLCVYAYAKDGRADAPAATPGTFDRRPREHLFPATLTRTATAWEMRFDLRTLYANAFLKSEDISIYNAAIYINGLSSGRWQANCAPGRQCGTNAAERELANAARVTFSRAPGEPGDYPIEATYTHCDPTPVGTAEPCQAGTELAVAQTMLYRVIDPNAPVHLFSRLTSPSPFAVLRGTTSARFAWTPPVTPQNERVKGYVLTVAKPETQESRHFEYLVTDPLERLSAGLPSATNPCGADGAAAECSLTLQFPLATVGGGALVPDDKFIVSLVTVFADGHRTDGMCDDGTPTGVRCPTSKGGANLERPGFDSREFFVSSRAWPLVFQDPATRNVLFVDFAAQRAQFLVWDPGSPRNILYRDQTRQIIGSNAQGGLVVFGGSAIAGANHLFAGVVTGGAAGQLVTYDPRGLPATPNGMPTGSAQQFGGSRVS